MALVCEWYEKKAANSFFPVSSEPDTQQRGNGQRTGPLVQAENRLFWLSSIFKTSFLGLLTG